MHQEVFDWSEPPPACPHGRCTRLCLHGGGNGGAPSLGLSVLTSDPLVELVYRGGLVSIQDLRALAACTGSPAIQRVAEERALRAVAAAAAALRETRAAWALCAARVRGLALDAEQRLLDLGVPMNAVHPELSSPLREGGASHHELHAGLGTFPAVLRAASHPAAWAPPPAGLWDALAGSASLSMRPQLVLLLSALLPVEARLSYVALRHDAYRAPGVHTLGGLVKTVLLRMLLTDFGPLDCRRLMKTLKQVAPSASPFSLWLLRRCARGGASHALTLAQRQRRRAEEEAELAARIDRLFERHQEQVLYNSEAWLGWLHALPTRHLSALYIKYLFDSFQ